MPANPLNWEDAGNDGHRDQNASTRLVAHGYWSLGDNQPHWNIELIALNDDLDPIDWLHGGLFPTEDAAKEHAQRCEDAA